MRALLDQLTHPCTNVDLFLKHNPGTHALSISSVMMDTPTQITRPESTAGRLSFRRYTAYALLRILGHCSLPILRVVCANVKLIRISPLSCFVRVFFRNSNNYNASQVKESLSLQPSRQAQSPYPIVMKHSLARKEMVTEDVKLEQKVVDYVKNGHRNRRIGIATTRPPRGRAKAWEITITAETQMEKLEEYGVTQRTRTHRKDLTFACQ